MSVNPGDRITVVLVRPIYPRNIGMCARAMANMGCGRLVLIAPQTEITEDAKQGATKAQAVLRGAITYPSLSEFYASEGEGLRLALSGRDGRLRTPEKLDTKLAQLNAAANSMLADTTIPIYLFFGPEDDGLNDEEIRHMHHVCSLPTYGEFFSMNLSHAVMLALYLLRSTLHDPSLDFISPQQSSDATKSEGELMKERLRAIRAPKYFPEKTIDTWLDTLGFDLDNRRVNAGRILKRILLENEPTHDELRILEAVIQQTVRKLQSGPK